MQRAKGLTYVVLVLIGCLGACATAPLSYDSLCEEIIRNARSAGSALEKGEKERAESSIEAARLTYEKATALDPQEPQAYLSMAILYAKTLQFTKSLPLFDRVLELVAHDPEATAMVRQSQQTTLYAWYSSERDAVYAEGAGDHFKAHEWALKQLTVSPNPALTLHETATLEMMLCEHDAAHCISSYEHFTQSQEAVFAEYTHGKHCTGSSRLYIGSWERHPDVTTQRLADGLLLHTVRKKVRLVGRDGVVLLAGNDGDCSLLSPSSDASMSLGDNIFDPKKGESAYPTVLPSGKRYLSLVQFAGSAFYHWLCETLPRLAAARKYLAGFEEVSVIVPSSPDAPFIEDTIRNLLKSWGLAPRVVTYSPPMLIPDGALHYVGWEPQPCPPRDERWPPSGAHCPYLAHPHALRLGRDSIHEVLGPRANGPTSAEKYVLVASRTRSLQMRQFDESALIALIESTLAQSDLRSRYSVKVFSQSEGLEPTLRLFRGAAAVVGVHGGALSNIIACDAGTPILEIGFNSTGGQVYRHVASALGLPYFFVHVDVDALGRGIGAPHVTYPADVVSKQLRSAIQLVGQPPNEDF